VVVTLRFNGGTFIATVRDEGTGFDFTKALRDESGPDPMSERGRGILIMRAFTDDLQFKCDDKGLTVELTKLRGGGGNADE
jgi:anti-sigma regulatory factor (Ser/Thr protein kinase)